MLVQFFNRLQKLKSVIPMNPRVIAREPDTVVIDDYVSSSDIKYLLQKAPELTEGITNDNLSNTYTLSPYKDDVVRFLCMKVAMLVGVPVQYLRYIDIDYIPVNSSLVKKPATYNKVPESPVATGPYGRVLGTASILLSDDATLLLNGSALDVKKAQIIGIQMVDEQDILYYNNILESGKVVQNDLWLCSFVFAEFPRELNVEDYEVKL